MLLNEKLSRRALMQLLLSSGIAVGLAPNLWAQSTGLIEKKIPSSGAAIPVIGLGSWITFNVGRDKRALANVSEIIGSFFQFGGRLIDSSPMYGSSQAAIGSALKRLGETPDLFSADKVWIDGAGSGKRQVLESLGHWEQSRFNLMQVHNLVDWDAHLPVLFDAKKRGDLDYVGVTTSHGRRHRELEEIMLSQPIDFVQLTYNMRYRTAENRLLPIAKERGIAVIVNRPYDGGRLIRAAKKKALPHWLPGIGIKSWADFFLKFNVSHPAVTCAIPATSNLQHLKENMAACTGVLPGAKTRMRMLAEFERT